jgi:hypothetical protein
MLMQMPADALKAEFQCTSSSAPIDEACQFDFLCSEVSSGNSDE